MSQGRPLKLPRGALPHLRRSDPGLARVIEQVGRCRMQVGYAETHLASLVRAIIYQQLSGKAAATIYGRFRALYPADRFPSAEEIRRTHHATLRKCGVSRQKQAALRDLCLHVAEGRLPLHDVDEHDDEVLIERLTAVRGIGRWSAQMFLMFALRRHDVLPVGDLGVRKAMQNIYALPELPKPVEMERIAQPWRPYCSVASWYLWRSLDGIAAL